MRSGSTKRWRWFLDCERTFFALASHSLFGYPIGQAETPKLNQGFFRWRPDAQAFDSARSVDPVRSCGSYQLSSPRLVEVNAQRIPRVNPVPSKYILPWLEQYASNIYGRLHCKVVRILAFGGITRGNQHGTRDKAPMFIHNSGCGPRFRFNVFTPHRRSRRHNRGEFGWRGLPPDRRLRRRT